MTRSIVIPGSHFATQVLRRPTLSALIHDQEAWTELQTLIARADAELQRRRDLPPIQGTTPDAVADKALRAGGELPVGFGKDAGGAAAEAETPKVELASLTRLRGGYVQELGVLVEESIPDMISALNADLQRVLDVAEEALTELDGNIDPLAAIKAKKSEHFAVLAEAHTDYLAIRANADLILQEQDSALRASAGWHRLMAGVARCWPAWYSTDRESPMTGWSRVDGAPWPADEESLEFLIWLVQNRKIAKPWVASAANIRAQRGADARPEEEAFQARHAVDGGAAAGDLQQMYGSEAAVARRYVGRQ